MAASFASSSVCECRNVEKERSLYEGLGLNRAPNVGEWM